ncbi:MAG: hypothetical protein AAF204_00560 [Pseudomonadota bacterium]
MAAKQCVQPASVMLMQGEDEKRLKLARSLKVYLQEEGLSGNLATAIYKASIKTGVDFELMVLKAKMESDLGRLNVATGSSARGAFQYIEPTWLTLIRRYGKDMGYEHYAKVITRPHYPALPDIKGSNPFLKAEILSLRHDPEVSALVKAYQVKEETDVIRSFKKGKRVTATDHYIAHMLGLPLMKEFYKMKNRGSVIAVAKLNNAQMREAAKLNRVFFYHGQRALTARESYAKFEKRVNREFSRIQKVAFNKKMPTCEPAKSASSKDFMS